MKKKPVLKCILLLFCYIVCAASQSLVLKADIGVIPVWDALTLNLTEITGIKIGYLAIIMNAITIAVWFIFLRKEFKPVRLLTVAAIIFSGIMTNLFYYNIFTFEVSSYAMRLVLLVGGNLLLSVAVSFITYIDLISFPAEGLCYTLERRFKFPIKITRTALDLFCILASLLLSLLFHTTLKIREGTVVSMLMVGPIMGVVMDFIRKRHWLD